MNIGTTGIADVTIGTTDVVDIHLGDALVWEREVEENNDWTTAELANFYDYSPFKASMTTNSGEVTSIASTSNATSLTAVNSTGSSVGSFNSLPTLIGTGGSWYSYNFGSTQGASHLLYAILFRENAAGSWETLVMTEKSSGGVQKQGLQRRLATTGYHVRVDSLDNTTRDIGTGPGSAFDSNFDLILAYLNNGQVILRQNGTELGVYTGGFADFDGLHNFDYIKLMAVESHSLEVFAVGVGIATYTTLEVEKIEGEYMHAAGIESKMPEGHPYKLAAPTE